MARTTTPLNVTQIDKAKPQAKEFTLADGKGLYLLIKPNGAKLWRLNYYKPFTQPKKRVLISIGRYPDVSLQQARQIRDDFNALLTQNVDPQEHREQEQQAKLAELNNTYESVAWAWLEYRKTKKNFSADYQKDVISLIKRNLLPHFGHLPITSITALMALKAFKPYQLAFNAYSIR